MITKINDYSYKSFKNYTGPNIDEELFRKKNILFGYNGKGKTALARGILMECLKEPLFKKENYRFFNKDYIRDNLLLDNNESLKGVVANFGKVNVDTEKEIGELSKKIIDVEKDLKDNIELQDKIENEIEKIFQDKKGNSNIIRKSGTNFKEKITKYNDNLNDALIIVKSKEELKNIKDSSSYEKDLIELENINIIKIPTLTEEELNDLERIMESEYNDNAIPSTIVLSWLKQGLEIHKDDKSSHCKFCGNNLDISSIENKVNEYLNDKKQQDLITVDNIYNKLKNIINLLDQINDNKIILGKLTNNETNENYESLINLVNNFQNHIKIIEKKINNFDNKVPLDRLLIGEINTKIINNLEEIKNIVNEKIKSLKLMLDKNNKLINGAIGLEINESTFIQENIKLYDEQVKNINKNIKLNSDISQKIDALKKSKSTTSDFANFINELLEALGIDFFLDIVNDNYVIKHKLDNVVLTLKDISEGENNLLALLLFYYELFVDNEQKELKNEIKMIIVDDPISSLDNLNKIFVLELVKKILTLQEPQVFVFTHVWEDFCNLCYGKEKNETFQFYEIKKNKNGSYIKKSKYNETPYKHDFKEIYEFSNLPLDTDLDECELYHYPNVMRKVLEEFMKFKVANFSPTLNNINNVTIALCGDNKPSNKDKIAIPVLLDVCNIMSHKSVRSSEEILKSAAYLMGKIKNIDKNHFHNMTN